MRTAKIYAVDWSDPPYPRIVLSNELYGDVGFTWGECRDQIIEHFRHEKNFAQMQINVFRNMKFSEWQDERKADRG